MTDLSNTGAYLQFDDIISRARETVASNGECQRIIREKTERIGSESYSIKIDAVILKPGKLEVSLRVVFSDRDQIQVVLDAEGRRVDIVKWYPKAPI